MTHLAVAFTLRALLGGRLVAKRPSSAGEASYSTRFSVCVCRVPDCCRVCAGFVAGHQHSRAVAVCSRVSGLGTPWGAILVDDRGFSRVRAAIWRLFLCLPLPYFLLCFHPTPFQPASKSVVHLISFSPCSLRVSICFLSGVYLCLSASSGVEAVGLARGWQWLSEVIVNNGMTEFRHVQPS